MKRWIKNHKKEIIVGSAVTIGTVLLLLSKKKKVINGHLSFIIGFGDDRFGIDSGSDVYANINFNNPDITVADLGKLKDLIKKDFPMISDDSKINRLSVNYSH